MGTTKDRETGGNTKHEIRRTKFDALPSRSASVGPLQRPKKRVLTSSEAADYLGYAGPSAAFNEFIMKLGVRPLRRGAYDRFAIDKALDAQGEDAPSVNYGEIDYG